MVVLWLLMTVIWCTWHGYFEYRGTVLVTVTAVDCLICIPCSKDQFCSLRSGREGNNCSVWIVFYVPDFEVTQVMADKTWGGVIWGIWCCPDLVSAFEMFQLRSELCWHCRMVLRWSYGNHNICMDSWTWFPYCHWMAGYLLNHDSPSISCSLPRFRVSWPHWSSGSCELHQSRSWLNCLFSSEPVLRYRDMRDRLSWCSWIKTVRVVEGCFCVIAVHGMTWSQVLSLIPVPKYVLWLTQLFFLYCRSWSGVELMRKLNRDNRHLKCWYDSLNTISWLWVHRSW